MTTSLVELLRNNIIKKEKDIERLTVLLNKERIDNVAKDKQIVVLKEQVEAEQEALRLAMDEGVRAW